MAEKNTKERSSLSKWTRRGFLGIGGLLGLGLVVGVGGLAYVGRSIKKYSGKGMGEGASLNAWIRIAPDNKITLAVARSEMGQGVYTALAQLIAEELEVNFEDVQVIHPQAESPYANTFLSTQKRENAFTGFGPMGKILSFMPVIATGGSTTVIDAWEGMRYAGATAREMLIQAAAKTWDVDASTCKAELGFVINTTSGERLSYGALAESAKDYTLDKLPTLKAKSEFKIVGKPVQRLDIPAKVNGTAMFGLDYKEKDMVYAAVKHAKITGNKITGFKNEEEVLKLPGVLKVVLTEYGKALVYADNSWRAMQAAKSLEVNEEGAQVPDMDSAYYFGEMRRIADEDPISVRIDKGDVQGITNEDVQEGERKLEAYYEVPYLAHACMEPVNATAIMENGNLEAWMGHQAISVAETMLNESSGVAKDKIKINITYLGGGFGRKGEPDFPRLIGAAAKAMQGKLVQMIFSREEDMKNDMYRPGAVCKMSGVVTQDGSLKALQANLAIQSVERQALGRIVPLMAPAAEKAKTTLEGLDNQAYNIPNHRVSFGNFETDILVGFWRSVSYSQNGFFQESFIDELAHAAGKDPLEFRRNMLLDQPRYLNVLDRLKEMSNWGKQEADTYQGIALQYSFESIVAQVAEIKKMGEKEFKIVNYYCVIDCGNTVNPDTIEAQMQSGIVFGLSAAIHGEISWKNGSPVQSNFHDYQMLKMYNCPKITVAIMENNEEPGGVGEPGVPPAAPALTNALFKATGERIRSLPLSKSDYVFV